MRSMPDPVDFSKIDPLLRDYILDMRETAKKAKAELKAVSLERDAYKEQLEEMKKAKLSLQTPDARTLSKEEYQKLVHDMRKDIKLKEYDEKLKRAFSDGQKDVREMKPEEYKEWKARMSGRKAW